MPQRSWELLTTAPAYDSGGVEFQGRLGTSKGTPQVYMSDTLQSANLAVWRLGMCCRLAGVVRLFRVKISGDKSCLRNCVDG